LRNIISLGNYGVHEHVDKENLNSFA